MNVYALVGESGSGKSHRALFVAKSRRIDYILDDGLLIKGNKKIAGQSAKRENTYIAAVKRAIFHYDDHRQAVVAALRQHRPKRLLILGTSENMVHKIAKRLELPAIDEIIMIRDVSTEADVAMAKQMRNKEGKHVIPVSSVELKQDFSGYFIDRLKLFYLPLGRRSEIVEKSVVRPTFSYMGKFTISSRAFTQIIMHCVGLSSCVARVLRVRHHNSVSGIAIDVDVSIWLDCAIHRELEIVMQRIHNDLKAMTNIHIIRLTIQVKASQQRT